MRSVAIHCEYDECDTFVTVRLSHYQASIHVYSGISAQTRQRRHANPVWGVCILFLHCAAIFASECRNDCNVWSSFRQSVQKFVCVERLLSAPPPTVLRNIHILILFFVESLVCYSARIFFKISLYSPYNIFYGP